jgi:hypothetical protein
VGKIEAVGYEYWATHFQTIERVLAPGGRVAIQDITIGHDRLLATRSSYTWVHKYIFPGGVIPSLRAIEDITEEDRAPRPGAPRDGRALRADAAALGRTFRGLRRGGQRRRLRCRSSSGFGCSVWAIPAPASKRATSMQQLSHHTPTRRPPRDTQGN